VSIVMVSAPRLSESRTSPLSVHAQQYMMMVDAIQVEMIASCATRSQTSVDLLVLLFVLFQGMSGESR